MREALRLTAPGYRDLGLRHWLLAESGAFDRTGRMLSDGHYSRRSPGARQFMPPGQRFALITRDGASVWGWWRPHPSSGLRAMNGLDGWTCTIFRRTSGVLASELVLDAECAIGALGFECGPHGLLTYVWDAKVRRKRDPGRCFRKAGWHPAGKCKECVTVKPRSADGRKTLLHKSFGLAGQQPAAQRPPDPPSEIP